MWAGDTGDILRKEVVGVANPDNLDYSTSPEKCKAPLNPNCKFTHRLSLKIMRFEMNNEIWKHTEALIWDRYFWSTFLTHLFRYHLMFYDKSTSPSVHHENHDKCRRLTWTPLPVGVLFILRVHTFWVTPFSKLHHRKLMSGISKQLLVRYDCRSPSVNLNLTSHGARRQKVRGGVLVQAKHGLTSRPSRQGPLPNLPPVNTDTNWEVYEI